MDSEGREGGTIIMQVIVAVLCFVVLFVVERLTHRILRELG